MEKKAVLNRLLEKEQSLREKATDLKSDLERLNSKIVSKQSEIDCLLAKVAELKSNKRRCKITSGDNNGESHQGRKRIKLNHEWVIEPERLAETVLHEEMWREVFSKVDDGLDLLNASRTCKHFYNILDPFKKNFLFGKVLPFIIPHLNLKDVLGCRFVCKDWRSSINSFLEEWTKIHMMDLPLTTSSIHPFSYIINSIDQAYSFRKKALRDYWRLVNPFLQQFSSSPRSPFIANSIKIILDSNTAEMDSKEAEFRNGIHKILDNYGRHIYHFNWQAGSTLHGSAGLVASQVLRKLFSQAQNLQTLVVEEYYYRCLDKDEEGFSRFEDITDTVPDLQSLSIQTQAENPIKNWLFQNFHLQIAKLHLRCFDGFDDASNFIWPKATELAIYCEGYSGDYLSCYESFPGLQKLCLTLPAKIQNPNLTLSEILRITQRLPTICPSFYALQLSFKGRYSLSPCETEELHCDPIIILFAPKELDTLELKLIFRSLCWEEVDFAFLLRFPLIKKLSVVYHPDLNRNRNGVQDDRMETVELVKYLRLNSNPSSSNVWRMLPNLETLQLQNKIYKRPKTSNPKCE